MAGRLRSPWGLWIGSYAILAVISRMGPFQSLLCAALLPVVTSCILATRIDRRLCAALVLGSAAVMVDRLMPWGLGMGVGLFCLCSLAQFAIRSDKPMVRGAFWLAACYGTAMLLMVQYQQTNTLPLPIGLAERFTDMVRQSDRYQELLVSAYQFGLSRLPRNMEKVALFRVGSVTIMPDVVRDQLLFSLQASLEILLTPAIPKLLVYWPFATALLCAALPDYIASRDAGWSELPRFETWGMPKGLGIAVGLLGLGAAAELAGVSGSWLFFCRLCGAAFNAVFAVQGMAMMWAGGKKTYRSSGGQAIWIGLTLVLFPLALVLCGVADQVFDLRHLRHTPDDEDDDL